MEPCKHLDYDGEYVECEIVEIDTFSCRVRHWKRNNPPYEGAPVNVQFCKLRGRINEIFACYNPGELPCHEPEVTVKCTVCNDDPAECAKTPTRHCQGASVEGDSATVK